MFSRYFCRRSLLLALLATSASAHAQRAASFGAVTTFSAGASSTPYVVAVADVNGDGRPDLLTNNYNASTVAVLLGAGTGSFGGATQYNCGVGSYPWGVTAADVNGDGKLDLLTPNNATNSVGVLLGTGTGSFGGPNQFSTGTQSLPTAVVTADVNGDGKLDLLTANSGLYTVGVLLGTGTGSFGPVTQVGTGAGDNPYAVAVADVNGDGKPDVLPLYRNTSRVGVLLGTGTGSFGALTTFSTGVGTSPFAAAVADVNGDNKLDLLTANSSTTTVGVLLGTGTGSFGPVTNISCGAPNSYPYGVAVGDVNGDGNLDLLVANSSTSTVGVLLGLGTGSFGPVTNLSSGNNSQPFGLVVADVNRDGRPDVLTANRGSDTAGVLLNTGTYALSVAGSPTRPSLTLFPNPALHGATTLAGAAPGQPVQVLDVLGRVTATTTADATGRVALVELASGLYVVRAGSSSMRLAVE